MIKHQGKCAFFFTSQSGYLGCDLGLPNKCLLKRWLPLITSVISHLCYSLKLNVAYLAYSDLTLIKYRLLLSSVAGVGHKVRKSHNFFVVFAVRLKHFNSKFKIQFKFSRGTQTSLNVRAMSQPSLNSTVVLSEVFIGCLLSACVALYCEFIEASSSVQVFTRSVN